MPDITDNMQTTATKAPRVVTKKQAQAILHCSRNYVEQLAAQGRIRYWRPSARHDLYSLDDIEALLATPFNATVQ